MLKPPAQSSDSIPDLTIEMSRNMIAPNQFVLTKWLKAHAVRVTSFEAFGCMAHPRVRLNFFEALPYMTALRSLNVQGRTQFIVLLLLGCGLNCARGIGYVRVCFFVGDCCCRFTV